MSYVGDAMQSENDKLAFLAGMSYMVERATKAIFTRQDENKIFLFDCSSRSGHVAE